MIDIETLGTDVDSVVVSLGAVFFDIETKQLGDTFYKRIEIQSQLNMGRKITENTLLWWFNQDLAARKVFSEIGVLPLEVLVEFRKWIYERNSKALVWGNGSSFDISILEHLYKDYKIAIPWSYKSITDFRTFKRFCDKGVRVEREGTYHQALDDAIYQAKFVLRNS